MPEFPDENTLGRLKKLRMDGRYLEAWTLVKDLAPPEEWPTQDGRLQGARLLDRIGASARSERMVLREWRRRQNPEHVLGDLFWEVLSQRGAFLTWQWLRRHAPSPATAAEDRSDYEGCLAVVLMRLRDFEAAETALSRGRALEPDCRWFDLLHADLLQEKDLRIEALEMATRVAQADPGYVSAIQTQAELLVELDREEEALQVLKESCARLQCASLITQRVALLIERNELAEAEAMLPDYERFLPLMDDSHADWLHSRRCDIASARGDIAEALREARQVKKSGFYRLVAEKLSAEGASENLRRVTLNVPFVRQHHKTCAPASVTSIARYWKREVDHLELADEICYDGTPDYRERQWAETHGWAAREFTVSVEAAQTLIDAGMPFIMDTVHPGGAHAQVVSGYDAYRTVLFIRDPGHPHTCEFMAAESLAEQAPYGPRGFILVPEGEAASRLAGIHLPDAILHDHFHRLRLALAGHDRNAAEVEMDALRSEHADHRLRWQAELALARYDNDQTALLAALEELLRRYPKVENWQTERLNTLRDLQGREAFQQALRELCHDGGGHAIHWRMLARELHWDAPQVPEARRWLRRVHRARLDSVAILTEANLLWEARQFDEAAELYRLAACLDEDNEGLWTSWFRAARWTRQPEAALTMLRNRFEAKGDLSPGPAETLYQSLEQLNLSHEALAVLEESLSRLPEDADHALFVAGECLLWNRTQRAREILDGIRKNARAAAWHRVQARLARQEGDGAAQLHHWRAVVADQPHDADARRSVAWLLEIQQGADAALAWLRESCAARPFDWNLHVALLDWSRDQGHEVWEQAVRELIRIDPMDAWAQRELASVLRAQKRHTEAHAALDRADTLQADNPAQHNIRASVFETEGRLEEAREECRQALRLEVDTNYAMRMLLRLCRGREQRLEQIRFIQEQIRLQTTSGDAVVTFVEQARPYLEDDELETFLLEAHTARTDLWHTGVQLAEHRRNCGRTDEALELLRAITERFPLMPRGWMELAFCLEASGDRAAAIEAGERARELNPGWAWGMRALSEMKRKSGDCAGARSVLEETLRHNPRDAVTHGWLAEVLWQQGHKGDALDKLAAAVDMDPGYHWAWNKLGEWGEAAGRPDAARAASEKLLRERPAESRTWLIRAEQLTRAGEFEERLAVLDKAMELAPDQPRAADIKARVLTLAGRYDAALKTCRDHPSADITLRLREAWILWQRGSGDEAIRVMDAALEEDPGHVWGWQLLTDWHQERQAYDRAELACRQQVRLLPQDEIPLGYLGSLLQAQGKHKEACETYERALKVSPFYLFAMRRLLEMHLEGKDWPRAQALLDRLAPYHPALLLDSWRVVLAIRRHQPDEAFNVIERMLQNPHDDSNCFQRVLEALGSSNAQLVRRVMGTSARLLEAGTPQLQAGAFHVELCKKMDRLPARSVMQQLPPDSEAGERAWAAWIYWIGERWSAHAGDWQKLWAWNERRAWRAALARHRAIFHARPNFYGAVSYTLHKTGQRKKLIEWFADWRERGLDMEPYMLNNLVLAHQERGDAKAATEVIQAGLQHPTHNAIKLRFHVWAALEHAMEERTDSAEDCLDAVNPDALDAYGKDLNKLLDLTLAYQPGREPPSFGKAQQETLAALLASHRDNPVIRQFVRRCCRLAGRRLKSIQPTFWGFVRDNEGHLKTAGFACLVLTIGILKRF